MSRLALLILVALLPLSARAIRPLVTDDAAVVGHRLGQVETWLEFGRGSVEHNVLVAVGLTPWLELTTGFTQGGLLSRSDRGYSVTGPVLQGKTLFREAVDGGAPGVALALGGYLPWGRGALVPPGWGALAYLAVTQSLARETILLHANVGFAFGENPTDTSLRTLVTGGVGAELGIVGPLHAVWEVIYGDPYDLDSGGWAMQAGFRYLLSDNVQFDGTVAASFDAIRGTVGLRLVSPELW